LPVVVVSSVTPQGSEAALRALELGAVDVVCKPGPAYTVAEVCRTLVERIRMAATARLPNAATAPAAPRSLNPQLLASVRTTHKVVAIGASTGGTQALREVLRQLPATTPGTLVVQHMPEHFTAAFARRLDADCLMEVREAQHGETLTPGLALVAPGNRHLVLRRDGALYGVEIREGPPVQFQRPSVDVLFHSVARLAGPNAVGAILTGMGADGARGLLAMRQAGAHTIAQDEATCVVYGMPKEAVAAGAVVEQAPLTRIAELIIAALTRQQATRAA
jgi:two-component system chemotaxis response regulator CheB